MRRPQTVAHDPKVEASRAELDIIEGQKNTAQVGVLAIAENKKRLEANFEETRTHLDTEISARKKELAAFDKTHKERMGTYEKEERDARDARDEAAIAQKSAEKDLEGVQASIGEQQDKKKSIDESVKSLEATEKHLHASIAHLAPGLRVVENKSAKAAQELAKLKLKIVDLEAKYAEQAVLNATEYQEYESLKGQKTKREEEIAYLDKIFAEISKKIWEGEERLVKVQNEHSLHEQEMVKREDMVNERLGNATRVEIRVDQKLDQLKQAETEFTTEHLTRIGYKKIGT